MPVAVRLVEVLAIVVLVATMAAGAAVIIFMEKCLLFLSMFTEPLVSVIGFFLGVLKYVFLVNDLFILNGLSVASSSPVQLPYFTPRTLAGVTIAYINNSTCIMYAIV